MIYGVQKDNNTQLYKPAVAHILFHHHNTDAKILQIIYNIKKKKKTKFIKNKHEIWKLYICYKCVSAILILLIS